MDDILLWKVTLSVSLKKIYFPNILEQAPLNNFYNRTLTNCVNMLGSYFGGKQHVIWTTNITKIKYIRFL